MLDLLQRAHPYPPDHLPSALARLSTTPIQPSPIVKPPEWTIGGWRTYPHSQLPPSYVHTPELKLHSSVPGSAWGISDKPSNPAVSFRHSGWLRTRHLVRDALDHLDASVRTLERFDSCGSDPWLVVDSADSSRLAIHSNHCHNRWCTPCSRERAHRIVGNLHPTLDAGDIRFLTLTLRHSDAPLSDQMDRLYDCFRRLRRLDFWKAAVSGGCAVLEVTHSHTDACWHVHLHCLLDGTWIDGREIRAAWWRITGDSYVVKVKQCSNADRAAHYLVKYVTKPVPATVINKPHALREMIAAFAGRRLVLTFASWRGVKLTEPLDSTDWKSICPLPVLYSRREQGDHDAWLILRALERILPEAAILAARAPPPPSDDPIGLLF